MVFLIHLEHNLLEPGPTNEDNNSDANCSSAQTVRSIRFHPSLWKLLPAVTMVNNEDLICIGDIIKDEFGKTFSLSGLDPDHQEKFMFLQETCHSVSV